MGALPLSNLREGPSKRRKNIEIAIHKVKQ